MFSDSTDKFRRGASRGLKKCYKTWNLNFTFNRKNIAKIVKRSGTKMANNK